MTAHCLVVAKAPVPGLAKTRLGGRVGMAAASEVAAAALLDTLGAVESAFGPGHRHLALAGHLPSAARGRELAETLGGWRVFAQRGRSFAERLANAHADVGVRPVVQIGMDTPQVTGGLLLEVAAGLRDHGAVLGPAEDGGWWVLALRNPADAEALRGVPASTPSTGADTLAALRARGLEVAEAPTLRDVDEPEDAAAVTELAPHGRFSTAWLAAAGPAVR